MTKRKEKNPLEFTEGNARRYFGNVRRTFGDPKARRRGEMVVLKKTSFE